MAHELGIAHVTELRVVMEGALDALSLHWAHADVLDLSIRKQLAVMAVLELDDLVNVGGRRRSTKLSEILLPGRGIGELARL